MYYNKYFQKKENGKWTWISPNTQHKNETDYIIASHKHIITDVTVINQFRSGNDHRLVRSKCLINTQKERKKLIKRNNKQKLNHEIKQLTDKRTELASENKRGTAEYTELNKLIRKKIKQDTHKHNEEIIERTTEENKSLKVLRRKLNNNINVINQLKSDNDTITNDRKEIIEIIAKYCENLYNSKAKKQETIKKRTIQNIGSEK